MKRITGKLEDGTIYVTSDRIDEGIGYFTTQRRLGEIIRKLAAYEDTGLEPSEIETLMELHFSKYDKEVQE